MAVIPNTKKLITRMPFEISEVLKAVKEAGMELVAVYDAFTREPVKENSDRVYFVVRECGK